MILMDTQEIIRNKSGKSYIEKCNCDTTNDVAIMLHTSGTTSNPKRVMLTHSNLINNIESNIHSLALTSNDKACITLPIYFGYCNTAQFLTHLYLGGVIIMVNGIFIPRQFFKLVEEEKITNYTCVPSTLLTLLKYNYMDNYDYNSLRYICFGGGRMPTDKLAQLIEKFPSIGFVQTYGQTECSPRITALMPEYSLEKIGSVGKAIPNVEIKIVNNMGIEVHDSQVGEIIVRGKSTMLGYYKQPEETSQVIRNGWVHTGDLGYVDNDGFLFLIGRIKNIIISGGINIYPEEVELVILQHECIIDVCVIGVDDMLLGEVPIAKVILKYEIPESELMRYCSERLSKYKIPVRFEAVKAIPKTYNGKIKRGTKNNRSLERH